MYILLIPLGNFFVDMLSLWDAQGHDIVVLSKDTETSVCWPLSKS